MAADRDGEITAGEIQREVRRLTLALTGAMPPGIPQDYLATAHGMMLSGTSVAVPATQFQQTPSGLLVPAAAVSAVPSFLDQAGVFLTGSEILGFSHEQFARVLPPESVESNLAAVGLESVALVVAFILRKLHTVGADPREADRELVTQLPPEGAARVTAMLDQDPRRRFIAPQILLLMLKLACEFSTDAPPAAVPIAVAQVMFALAEYNGATDSNKAATPSGPGRPGQLGRFVISTQVFHAGPDEVNVLGRFCRRWLQSATSDPSDRSVCDLPALFEQATGVPLDDWVTVGLCLYGVFHNPGNPPFIDLSVFAQSIGWSLERLEAVLRYVCTDTSTLRQLVKKETARFGLDWAFGSFERYPLLRLADGRVVIIDPHLLMRRFFSWLPIFDLRQGLVDQSSKREAERATTYMRKLSEHYALDALSAAVDGQTQRLYDDGALKNAFHRRGKGPRIADAAIDYGSAWLVVEVTTSMLTRESTAGVSDKDVLADIDKLVDEAEQIDSTIKSLREDEQRLTGFPAPPGRSFYPLLVVTEGFPVNPFTLSLLRDKAREKGLLIGGDVAQLEVVDLVELEGLEGLSESGGPSIVEVLARKRHAALCNSSVRDFVLRELNLQPSCPKRLDYLWKSLLQVVARTLGVDGHTGAD